MHAYSSDLEGKVFPLYLLEEKLKPEGFAIGGGWDYDHGSFDYPLELEGTYVHLRLPFKPVSGELDRQEAYVEFRQPFLLAHQYQDDVDIEASSGNIQASFNQFQSPVDEDATLSSAYVAEGERILRRVEDILS
ncbi:YugN family protein [Jeotgalibacillus sp. R-1-5s-1]|uniref:YugN family protein n=1 Tax=Jeotgalibacillus sp. R-1-5s-1 TaxID=2555897 RepID=UPI00106BE035|nr:YugN family protein [Jeotgalibacillus sp. R-1-5s-1]TFD95961.1 hypothetical protein E2491_12390 [Jeotgalibacillus sp. R-1-5s-1]